LRTVERDLVAVSGGCRQYEAALVGRWFAPGRSHRLRARRQRLPRERPQLGIGALQPEPDAERLVTRC